MEILSRDALGRVDEQDRHVRTIHRPDRSQRRVCLETRLDLAAPPESRAIDEQYAAAVTVEHRVDRVSRRPWLWPDHRALAPDGDVQQAGVADVRPLLS